MKLIEELKQSGKVLSGKGFTDEGKLLTKLAENKLEAFVLVTDGVDSPPSVDPQCKCVFLSKSKAEEAKVEATCRRLRESGFYELEDANNLHNCYSESEVAKKATSIFGTKIMYKPEKFKLPKDATVEQLIEFAKYIGYAPIVLKKIKLEA